MKKFAVLGAGMLMLSGCALPVPIQVASWALDGISYLMTDKSVTDHGLSILAQQDCAVLRVITDPEELCRDFDEMATALADGGSYAKVLFGDDAEEGEEIDETDIAAIAEFETAAGGEIAGLVELDTPAADYYIVQADDVQVDWAHDQLEALLVPVDKVADRIALSVAFDNEADLNNYPHQVVATAPVLEIASSGWRAHTTRIAGTDKEPTAGYYFVIGSFREHDNARKLRNKYRGLTPSVLSAKLDWAMVYRVVVGPFEQAQTQGIRKQIFRAGISGSWAIQVNPGEWLMAVVDPPALAPVEVAALNDAAVDPLEWNALSYVQMLSQLVY